MLGKGRSYVKTLFTVLGPRCTVVSQTYLVTALLEYTAANLDRTSEDKSLIRHTHICKGRYTCVHTHIYIFVYTHLCTYIHIHRHTERQSTYKENLCEKCVLLPLSSLLNFHNRAHHTPCMHPFKGPSAF